MKRAALILAVVYGLVSAGTAFALTSTEGEIKTAVKSGVKPVKAAKKAAAVKTATKPEKEEEDDKKTEVKTVRGKVMGAMKRALSVGLVSNDQDAPSEDMLLSLDKDTQLLNVDAVSDLKYGDGVKVDYEITFREDKNTKERQTLSTTAKRITLIQKAKPVDLGAGGGDEE